MYTYSIIICTKNRPSGILSLLTDLAAQRVNSSLQKRTEIVVIDSSRDTQSKMIIKQFQKRGTYRIRYFFSDKNGVSFARNIGVAKAGGEFLCFLDDDIHIPPLWLTTLNRSIQKNARTTMIYYGPIIPLFPNTTPNPGFVHDVLLATPWVFTSVSKKSQPFTANVCIHQSVFRSIGPFREVFGNNEGEVPLPFGEDPDFFLRAMRRHIRFQFLSSLTVHHYIDHKRVRIGYLIRRYMDDGMNTLLFSYYRRGGVPPRGVSLFSVCAQEFFNAKLLDNHPRHIAWLYVIFHKIGVLKGCIALLIHRAYFERYYEILTQRTKSSTIQGS